MRILVISDTHIPAAATKLPEIIINEAKNSDCCVHAGDFISYDVFAKLKQITAVYGVRGNMDTDKIRALLPEKRIITLEGVNIGITHGYGSPLNVTKRIKNVFSAGVKDINMFIFGHSHSPLDEEIDGKIYFNPGSPTDTVYASFTSYGIVEINNGKIKRNVIKSG